MEIARDTMDRSFLLYAKIKVKGVVDGFLPPIIELPCQGIKIHLGLFTLDSGAPKVISIGRTHALLRRSLGEEGFKHAPAITESTRSSVGIKRAVSFAEVVRQNREGKEGKGDGGMLEVGGSAVQRLEEGEVEWVVVERLAEGEVEAGAGEFHSSAWETRGFELLEGRVTQQNERIGAQGIMGAVEGSIAGVAGAEKEVPLPPKKRVNESDNWAALEGRPVSVSGDGPSLSIQISKDPVMGLRWRPKKKLEFKRPVITRWEDSPLEKKKQNSVLLFDDRDTEGERDTGGGDPRQPFPLFYQRNKRPLTEPSPTSQGTLLPMAASPFLALSEGEAGMYSEGNESGKESQGAGFESSEMSYSDTSLVSSDCEENRSTQFVELGEVGFLNEVQEQRVGLGSQLPCLGGESGLLITPIACVPPNVVSNQCVVVHSSGSEVTSGNEIPQCSLALSKSHTINIGGKKVEWGRLKEVLRKMELQLVPKEEICQEQGLSRTIRRKGKERELKNLEFHIKYDRNYTGVANVNK